MYDFEMNEKFKKDWKNFRTTLTRFRTRKSPNNENSESTDKASLDEERLHLLDLAKFLHLSIENIQKMQKNSDVPPSLFMKLRTHQKTVPAKSFNGKEVLVGCKSLDGFNLLGYNFDRELQDNPREN